LVELIYSKLVELIDSMKVMTNVSLPNLFFYIYFILLFNITLKIYI